MNLYRSYINLDEGCRSWDQMDIITTPYKVIKHTPKGWWIEYPNAKGKKLVLDGAGKRFAHPTVDESIQALIKRKQAHMRHILRTYNEVAMFLTKTAGEPEYDHDTNGYGGWCRTTIVPDVTVPSPYPLNIKRQLKLDEAEVYEQ